MKSAVVLMAYGSPERLSDVPAYYADIRGGRPIAPEHLADLVERYRRLGIEDSSPLNAITEETRAALEAELGHAGLHRDEALDAAHRGRGRVGGLLGGASRSSVSCSRRTTRRCRSRATASSSSARSPAARELRFVESWHDEPGFVELLADRVRGTDAHVVFTAHSLPARILEAGDPYRDQLLETSRLVAEAAGLTEWSFSFQSESPTGEPWLGPDILDHLEALHRQGVERVLVCPVGFVSDHLEIRWDLDVEAQEKAAELGMQLARIEMPNADPRFIRTLG